MIEIACSSESSNTRAPRKPAVHATSANSGARRRSASGPMVATSPASSSNLVGRSYDGSPSRYRLIQVRDERTAAPISAAASSASAASGCDLVQAAAWPAACLTGATLTAPDVSRIRLRASSRPVREAHPRPAERRAVEQRRAAAAYVAIQERPHVCALKGDIPRRRLPRGADPRGSADRQVGEGEVHEPRDSQREPRAVRVL